MRNIMAVCCVAVLAGCAKSDQPAAEPAAPGIDLASIAGRWSLRVMPENSDSTLVTSELVATSDTAGWTVTVPPTVQNAPVRVLSVSGDSIMLEQGPYESALRRGVMVTVSSVYRLREDRIVGTAVARYQTTGPDTLLRLRVEGTRAR